MFWQKIKSGLKGIKTFIQTLFKKLLTETESETKDRKFLFFFFSSFLCVIFFLIFILAGKNPFTLLIPFELYDLPASDKRTSVNLFLSDGHGDIVKSNRKVLLFDNDIRKNLHNLIGELSQPPYEDKVESTDLNAFPKKLPNIRNSINVFWLLDNNSRLVIDLNQSSIIKELSEIRIKNTVNVEESIFDEEKPEGKENLKKTEETKEEKRMEILNTTLLALEKTVFENFPTIKTIEYKLDGKESDYPGLKYKLTEIKKR